ncbi:polyketide synthase [Streptomyces sp. NPDC056534]|uniref:beta-ketoacyl [acyl carrier protein] synthase domain-containing protein n=1 Tax=Streptomyces sp. NPDC056534 TaxID=3345857 RepID=UPI0036A99D2F
MPHAKELTMNAHLSPSLAREAREAREGDPSSVAAPVAIVGMDCRFPGASDADALWELLDEGRHYSSPLPSDRGWDQTFLYNEDRAAEGTTYVRRGGFLEDVAGFDAAFFGIGPLEASAMDPQQRLLMESAWRALEHSRIPPGSLKNSSTGVYVGLVDGTYHALAHGSPPPGLETYLLTGNFASIASGRISYFLGLNGPALTLDTACSSGLVALHVAVQALRAGECETALVASSAVLGSPEVLVRFRSRWHRSRNRPRL